MLWIRDRFLQADAAAFAEHVVHGHTPVWRRKLAADAPEVLEHRTNLDTGASDGSSVGVSQATAWRPRRFPCRADGRESAETMPAARRHSGSTASASAWTRCWADEPRSDVGARCAGGTDARHGVRTGGLRPAARAGSVHTSLCSHAGPPCGPWRSTPARRQRQTTLALTGRGREAAGQTLVADPTPESAWECVNPRHPGSGHHTACQIEAQGQIGGALDLMIIDTAPSRPGVLEASRQTISPSSGAAIDARPLVGGLSAEQVRRASGRDFS